MYDKGRYHTLSGRRKGPFPTDLEMGAEVRYLAGHRDQVADIMVLKLAQLLPDPQAVLDLEPDELGLYILQVLGTWQPQFNLRPWLVWVSVWV
jgi:hypothetical protein